MSRFACHLFVCTNVRKPDDPRGCCSGKGSEAVLDALKQKAHAAGLKGKVRVNKAGCMDRCQGGPIAVVYPAGVWYTYVDERDIDEIVESHLQNGKVVERLLTPPHLGR